ncbi:MAG TPA: 30S ribosomal protein S19e [Nitrososphaerales archaeon]|nr:30S ribosomal protein S19e [Nitrososphaerales archaeon]
MPTVYDVPQQELISRLSSHLKHVSQISPPAWTAFAKTGSHAERQPSEKDWWYTRCASLLRKIYIHGPVGLSHLEGAYGGRKEIGYSVGHHRDSGGSSIRKAIQQLEAAGFVAKQGRKGRVLTGKGVSLVDRMSYDLLKELSKSNAALSRYL